MPSAASKVSSTTTKKLGYSSPVVALPTKPNVLPAKPTSTSSSSTAKNSLPSGSNSISNSPTTIKTCFLSSQSISSVSTTYKHHKTINLAPSFRNCHQHQSQIIITPTMALCEILTYLFINWQSIYNHSSLFTVLYQK